MVHAAIFDSVNAIDPGFSVYAVHIQRALGASSETAAAHRVLVMLIPSQRQALDAAYAASSRQIVVGDSKTKGIHLGETVAANRA